MKNVFHETRSETIARHTEDMFRELRVTPQQWTAELVAEYYRLVPPHKRAVHFQTIEDEDLTALGDADRITRIAKVLASNAQTMNRCRSFYDDNAIRFPVDLEEAWKNALRAPYRERLRQDLAQRDGLMFAMLPDLAGVSDVESVSQVTQHFARSLTAVAPTMTDQVIDAKDLPHIPTVLTALDALIGSATSLRARYVAQANKADSDQL